MEKISELKWEEITNCSSDNRRWIAYINGGYLSVLDRKTGFSYCHRDTETAYVDNDRNFWCVSGMFDIRRQGDLTVTEAIALIKEKATMHCQARK